MTIELTKEDLDYIGDAIKDGFQAGSIQKKNHKINWGISFWDDGSDPVVNFTIPSESSKR